MCDSLLNYHILRDFWDGFRFWILSLLIMVLMSSWEHNSRISSNSSCFQKISFLNTNTYGLVSIYYSNIPVKYKWYDKQQTRCGSWQGHTSIIDIRRYQWSYPVVITLIHNNNSLTKFSYQYSIVTIVPEVSNGLLMEWKGHHTGGNLSLIL